MRGITGGEAPRRPGPKPLARGVWRVPGFRPDGGWHVVAVDREGVIRRERIVYNEEEEDWFWAEMEIALELLDPEPERATPRLTLLR